MTMRCQSLRLAVLAVGFKFFQGRPGDLPQEVEQDLEGGGQEGDHQRGGPSPMSGPSRSLPTRVYLLVTNTGSSSGTSWPSGTSGNAPEAMVRRSPFRARSTAHASTAKSRGRLATWGSGRSPD